MDDGSSSDSIHASSTTRYPTWMPQVCGHVHSLRYTFYGSPPACYHRGYVVVLIKWRSRPHECLQRKTNTLDQQVWGVRPEEGGSLHLLCAWSTTKAGDDHIHLLNAATTDAEHAGTRGWGKLRQSRPSWYQGGKYRCWMGIGWLEVQVCRED